MDIAVSFVTGIAMIINTLFGVFTGFDKMVEESITNDYEMSRYEYFENEFWGNDKIEDSNEDYIEFDIDEAYDGNDSKEEFIEDESIYKFEINNNVITNIGEGNKIVRMYLPSNIGETISQQLEVEEVEDYEEARVKNDTYAFIIGKDPLNVSDINGEWEYNTLIIPGLAFKYPNFLEVSRVSFTHEVPSMVLASKLGEVSITLGSYIAGGQTVDSIYNAYLSQYDTLTKGENWVFSYSNEATMGRFNFNKLDNGRANEFFGTYPIYIEERFSRALEESVLNFEGCEGFPYLKVD